MIPSPLPSGASRDGNPSSPGCVRRWICLRALRALQLAQKDLLNSDQNASAADSSGPTDYSRPFYWVSFVLMGNEIRIFVQRMCPVTAMPSASYRSSRSQELPFPTRERRSAV
jgi:hypothetical protein